MSLGGPERIRGKSWEKDWNGTGAKVVQFEHAPSFLAEKWPEDCHKSELSTLEKRVEEMSKTGYQKLVENLTR